MYKVKDAISQEGISPSSQFGRLGQIALGFPFSSLRSQSDRRPDDEDELFDLGG